MNKPSNYGAFATYKVYETDDELGCRYWILSGFLDKHKKGYIFKYKSFNEFDETSTRIPKGAKRGKRVSAKTIKKHYWDPARRRLTPNSKFALEWTQKWQDEPHTIWYTLDNGGRPFMVTHIRNNHPDGDTVYVSKFPDTDSGWYVSESDLQQLLQETGGFVAPWLYAQVVATYANVEKVWKGRSPKTKMTKFSGGWEGRDGNTILIQTGDGRYVYVGGAAGVYEFSTGGDDTIIDYVSPVGNSSVPYPTAMGLRYMYFMDDETRVPLAAIRGEVGPITRSKGNDGYGWYYGHEQQEIAKKSGRRFDLQKWAEIAEPMPSLKMIHGRL